MDCCVAGEYSLATSPAMTGLQALGCTPRRNSRRVLESRPLRIWVAWAGEYSLATLPRLPSQHCGWVCKRCGCFGRRCQGCWGVLPSSIPGSRSSTSGPWPPQVLNGAAGTVLRSVVGRRGSRHDCVTPNVDGLSHAMPLVQKRLCILLRAPRG